LQTARLFEALPQLVGSRLLSAQTVVELEAAYRFLRTLENRLQMQRDEQTHQLPSEPTRREQLARAMREADWPTLQRRIQHERAVVLRHFNALVFRPSEPERGEAGERPAAPGELPPRTAGPGPAPGGPLPQPVALAAESAVPLAALWGEGSSAGTIAEALEARGLGEAQELARLIVELRDSARTRRLDAASHRRLQLLLPRLLAAMRADDEHVAMLRRFVRVIEAIGARSA
jgi:glutamate-ammonia-ligase adenylyltransferase